MTKDLCFIKFYDYDSVIDGQTYSGQQIDFGLDTHITDRPYLHLRPYEWYSQFIPICDEFETFESLELIGSNELEFEYFQLNDRYIAFKFRFLKDTGFECLHLSAEVKYQNGMTSYYSSKVSNRFTCSRNSHARTTLISYRHSDDLQSIPYSNAVGYFQQMRIPTYFLSKQTEGDGETYNYINNEKKEHNLGRVTRQFYEKWLVVNNDTILNTLSLALDCDYIYFDKTRIIPKEVFVYEETEDGVDLSFTSYYLEKIFDDILGEEFEVTIPDEDILQVINSYPTEGLAVDNFLEFTDIFFQFNTLIETNNPNAIIKVEANGESTIASHPVNQGWINGDKYEFQPNWISGFNPSTMKITIPYDAFKRIDTGQGMIEDFVLNYTIEEGFAIVEYNPLNTNGMFFSININFNQDYILNPNNLQGIRVRNFTTGQTVIIYPESTLINQLLIGTTQFQAELPYYVDTSTQDWRVQVPAGFFVDEATGQIENNAINYSEWIL